MKKMLLVCMTICTMFALSGCGLASKQEEETAQFFAMDTMIYVTVYGENAAGAIAAFEQEVYRLDRLLSAYDENSDIWRINAAGGKAVTVADETAEVISRAIAASQFTGGAFDITIAPVVQAWEIGTESERVPAKEEISALLERVNSDLITANGSVILLRDGAKIDLGGIAKGYAAERLAAVLLENGAECAVFSLGGNVQTVGEKSGGLWRVAVQDPADSSGYAAVIDIDGTWAVVTSGGYQRFFEENGVRYHHIIDPSTGYPAESGLLSVTVVCDDGALADALSTGFFVMGIEKSLEVIEGLEGVECVFISDENEVLYTGGLAGKISVYSENYALKAIGE